MHYAHKLAWQYLNCVFVVSESVYKHWGKVKIQLHCN